MRHAVQVRCETLTCPSRKSPLTSLAISFVEAIRSPTLFQSTDELLPCPSSASDMFESKDCIPGLFRLALMGSPRATRCEISSIAYSVSLGTKESGIGRLKPRQPTQRTATVGSRIAYRRLSDSGIAATTGVTCQKMPPMINPTSFARYRAGSKPRMNQTNMPCGDRKRLATPAS